MKKIVCLMSVIILMMLLLNGCEEIDNSKMIYQDNNLQATFKGVKDVAGYIGIAVELKNTSDSEITVVPLNSSVNETMVQFTSGMPATIEPGKTFNQVWMVVPENVGIKDASEVTNVAFSLMYGDAETDAIDIDL